MDISLGRFLSDYYAPLQGISDRTLLLYGFTIRSFEEFIGHEATLADLDEVVVARFLASRVRSRSPATAAKDRAQLRAMWELAARRGMVKTWPTIKTIVVPERVPEAWVTEDMAKLFVAVSGEKGSISGIPAKDFWKALLLLNYETGERCGGLLSLRWSDVTANGAVFRAEGRKGRRRDIYREISAECSAALSAIRRDFPIVFPWDKSATYLWRRLGVILKRAGLPNDRRCKFHKIRRTTASYYEAAGGSAQQLLDHSSPVVTKRYIDPRIVRSMPAHAAIPKVS